MIFYTLAFEVRMAQNHTSSGVSGLSQDLMSTGVCWTLLWLQMPPGMERNTWFMNTVVVINSSMAFQPPTPSQQSGSLYSPMCQSLTFIVYKHATEPWLGVLVETVRIPVPGLREEDTSQGLGTGPMLCVLPYPQHLLQCLAQGKGLLHTHLLNWTEFIWGLWRKL